MDKKYTAIITGGGSGIGEATAKVLLDNNYKVISIGLHKPSWVDDNFEMIEHDLLDLDETKLLAQKINKRENITHFIHNAGMILPNLIEDMDVNDLSVK